MSILSRGKYKIFLGGYINEPNAQNINCDAIARFIDKTKFEVHICYDSTMPVDKEKYIKMGIHLHRVIRHRYIDVLSKYLAMLFTNCEIYYLPKREKADVLFAQRHREKKLLGSVEGNPLSPANSNELYREYYLSLMTNSFAISKSVAKNVKIAWGKELKVIPFGTELQANIQPHKKINSVVWVGSVAEHKRPLDLIDVACAFPELHFIVIGKGELEPVLKQKIEELKLNNVEMKGQLSNSKVYETMKECDLLIMTSEFEGSPKVIQEAAACGLCSIYINKNYTVDFIQNGLNGFGVESIELMICKLKELKNNLESYKSMSENAIIAIQKYDWSTLISLYEDYFISLIEEETNERVD